MSGKGVAKVVGVWYDEKDYYHISTDECDLTKVCGHYRQVIFNSNYINKLLNSVHAHNQTSFCLMHNMFTCFSFSNKMKNKAKMTTLSRQF